MYGQLVLNSLFSVWVSASNIWDRFCSLNGSIFCINFEDFQIIDVNLSLVIPNSVLPGVTKCILMGSYLHVFFGHLIYTCLLHRSLVLDDWLGLKHTCRCTNFSFTQSNCIHLCVGSKKVDKLLHCLYKCNQEGNRAHNVCCSSNNAAHYNFKMRHL